MEVDRVFGDEAFEERMECGVVVGYGGELGIELGDVGADAAMEDLLTVAAFDVGAVTAAGGEEEKKD